MAILISTLALITILLAQQASANQSGFMFRGPNIAAVPQLKPSGSFDEHRCCYPRTWQAIMYRYPVQADVQYYVKYYQDDTRNSVVLDVKVTFKKFGNTTRYLQIIKTNDASNIANVYQFDPLTKKCVNYNFAGATYDQITGRCVPQGSFYLGIFTMGSSSDYPLRGWMWKPLPKLQNILQYQRMVGKDCAPAMGVLKGKVAGTNYLQMDHYINIKTRIDDYSMFSLPDYCLSSTTKQASIASTDMETFFSNLILDTRTGSNVGIDYLFPLRV